MKAKDILKLESSDTRQACVFEENGHWYAYEQSANRIENFVKGFVDFKPSNPQLRAYMIQKRK